MEREKTGVELLLSDPEIVAWLGLDTESHDAPAPTRRSECAGEGRARLGRQVGRPSEVRQAVPTARGLRFRMLT
jgi:hypothetical protein